MYRDTSVARREVEVIDPDGFHMRHADEFVRLAQRYRSEVWVLHKGDPYDGKSILDLMTMAAACGSRLKLEARGPDAETAIEALADLIRSSPRRRGPDISLIPGGGMAFSGPSTDLSSGGGSPPHHILDDARASWRVPSPPPPSLPSLGLRPNPGPRGLARRWPLRPLKEPPIIVRSRRSRRSCCAIGCPRPEFASSRGPRRRSSAWSPGTTGTTVQWRRRLRRAGAGELVRLVGELGPRLGHNGG